MSLSFTRRLSWHWFRAMHWLEIERYDDTAVLPNLRLLHLIMERVEPDLFLYLIERRGKQLIFNSHHRNILVLIGEIERRLEEIRTNRSYKTEDIATGPLAVRDFFISTDRHYVGYLEGYRALRSVVFELLEIVETRLEKTNSTLLDDFLTRRSLKMLLTMERLILAVCR